MYRPFLDTKIILMTTLLMNLKGIPNIERNRIKGEGKYYKDLITNVFELSSSYHLIAQLLFALIGHEVVVGNGDN